MNTRTVKYSYGVIEVKIFRQMFGSYELFNYKLAVHDDLDSLFELAEIPKIR